MMSTDYPSRVNKWDVFEVQVEGTSEGNPFAEQRVTAVFSNRKESTVVEGFYDGNGIYKVRFMPVTEGKHTFAIRGTFMNGSVSGVFYVDPAKETNKGPVRVNGYHFTYENGEPYRSVGTTAYVWTWQGDEKIEETIASLKAARFNKIRFCIFPKHYVYNFHEPSSYPYEGTPMDASVITEENFLEFWGKDNGSEFDHYRFNPAHFAKLEECIAALGEAGIEADLILFHPYDRWGFSCMTKEENDFYLSYVVRRLSAYHNVWWALANEWDLIPSKTAEDWEHYGKLVEKLDRCHHPRSIHNCMKMYDHTQSWITHASVQRVDLYKGAELTDEFRTQYGKPVVMDEIAYEGNIPHGWGNITGEEMIRRFWETAVRGGYPGHGETYLNDENVLWWSHGGTLRGESWKRVGFLLDIMNEVPGTGLTRVPMEWDSVTAVTEEEKDEEVKSFYLFYYTFMRPSSRTFHIDDTTVFKAEVIDTWNMTVTDAGEHSGTFTIALPGTQYMAIRLTKTGTVEETAEEETIDVIEAAVEAAAAQEAEQAEETLPDAAEEVPAADDENTEIIEVIPDLEEAEVTELPAEEAEEESELVRLTPVEDDEDAAFDAFATLQNLTLEPEEEETPAETVTEDEEVDLTLKMEELDDEEEEEAEPAELPEETEEETPVVEPEEEEEDDILDLIETEQDIESTIQLLKFEAQRSGRMNDDTFPDLQEFADEAEDEIIEDAEEAEAGEETLGGVTGDLREALDSILLTGEQEMTLDEVLETAENAQPEEEELPDLITGRFPIISELTHRLFRSKK